MTLFNLDHLCKDPNTATLGFMAAAHETVQTIQPTANGEQKKSDTKEHLLYKPAYIKFKSFETELV